MPVPVMTIDGDVISIYSHWTEDGSRIETEATVRTVDGDVVVNQIGGTVDGLAMIQMPGPQILALGMRVAVAAHRDFDLLQHEHVVLDSVRVLAYPPGYVRTTSAASDKPLSWASQCAYVTVDAAGTSAMPMSQEMAIVDAAIDEWNTKTDSCSYFQLINDGTRALDVSGSDHVNLIKIRDTTCQCPAGAKGPPVSWGCRPAVGNSPAHCYDNGAAGITTAVYINKPGDPRDGEIQDADIEINAVNFDLVTSGGANGPRGLCAAALQNTLTHELGHLHGLEHTCYIQEQDPGWIDNHGNRVPSCSEPGLPASIVQATMYPTQVCGEVAKESLTADDVQMMCDVYATRNDPPACERVGTTGGGCCSASASGRAEGSLLLAGTTILLLMRRRKTARPA